VPPAQSAATADEAAATGRRLNQTDKKKGASPADKGTKRHNRLEYRMKLTENMVDAWRQRAQTAMLFVVTASQAPGLFKPDAVEQARRDYARATAEMSRWSA
jgi:hypothetical protein